MRSGRMPDAGAAIRGGPRRGSGRACAARVRSARLGRRRIGRMWTRSDDDRSSSPDSRSENATRTRGSPNFASRDAPACLPPAKDRSNAVDKLLRIISVCPNPRHARCRRSPMRHLVAYCNYTVHAFLYAPIRKALDLIRCILVEVTNLRHNVLYSRIRESFQLALHVSNDTRVRPIARVCQQYVPTTRLKISRCPHCQQLGKSCLIHVRQVPRF